MRRKTAYAQGQRAALQKLGFLFETPAHAVRAHALGGALLGGTAGAIRAEDDQRLRGAIMGGLLGGGVGAAIKQMANLPRENAIKNFELRQLEIDQGRNLLKQKEYLTGLEGVVNDDFEDFFGDLRKLRATPPRTPDPLFVDDFEKNLNAIKEKQRIKEEKRRILQGLEYSGLNKNIESELEKMRGWF